MLFIFDLDQTLIDSKIALDLRKRRNWKAVYDLIPKMAPYPYVYDTIKHIKCQGHKIAIVTTSPKKYASLILEQFNLSINILVAYHDVKQRKPHPESILLATAKAKSSPNDTISFGDRAIDIAASNSAGVKSCACIWDSFEVEELINSNPDFIFNTPEEMYNYIVQHY